MAEPTPKELLVIKEFRSMVADLELTDEERTDMSLLAWLRARELDLKKSFEMLKTSIEWKKTNDIANISSWTPPEQYENEFQYTYIGDDIDGNPVGFLPVGIWDIRKAMEAGEREIWIKYTDKLFAKIMGYIVESSKKYQKTLTQFIVVMDFKGFSMRQLTCLQGVESILEVVRRFEANYPETLKAALVVNAPYIFNIIFNLVKPLLSKRTLGKVEIHGSNEKKWKPVLLKRISAENLPIAYGGTNPFTFKQTSSINSNENENATEMDFTSTQIEPGDKLQLHFDVTQPNTTFKWHFKTESYDIGFSVIYNGAKEVVPYKRYNSHLQNQRGSVTCENLGKYLLVFDNSYSRMKRKTLHYYVINVPPIDDVIED